jgi:hypothetical protein
MLPKIDFMPLINKKQTTQPGRRRERPRKIYYESEVLENLKNPAAVNVLVSRAQKARSKKASGITREPAWAGPIPSRRLTFPGHLHPHPRVCITF